MVRTILVTVLLAFLQQTAHAKPSAAQAELCDAARTGTQAQIAAALAKGAKVDGYCVKGVSRTALGIAMTVANIDNMKALIAAGAKVAGTRSNMPLGYARNAASAQLLIDHGAKVNMVDDMDSTPLMHLTSSLHSNFADFSQMTEQDTVEIARLLIAHGANVKFADKNGNTALIDATFDCLPDLTALLIENGADVNAAAFGETPLARLENVKDMNPGPCAATEQVLLAHGARK